MHIYGRKKAEVWGEDSTAIEQIGNIQRSHGRSATGEEEKKEVDLTSQRLFHNEIHGDGF